MKDFEAPYGATPLDPSELEGLRVPNVSTRAQLDELESHCVSAGRLWLSRRKHKDTLNDEFLRTVHKKLFGELWTWAGTYRTTEKNIGIDPMQIGVQVRHLLDDAKYWLEHRTYERIEFAARFHHRLVKIHPFPNGNGRWARIYTNGMLTNAARTDPVTWGSGKAHAIPENDERHRYIDALRVADAGDLEPLVRYLADLNS